MVKYHFYTILGSHFGFMQIMDWPHHNKYIPNIFLVPHIYIYIYNIILFHIKIVFSSGDMTEI